MHAMAQFFAERKKGNTTKKDNMSKKIKLLVLSGTAVNNQKACKKADGYFSNKIRPFFENFIVLKDILKRGKEENEEGMGTRQAAEASFLADTFH